MRLAWLIVLAGVTSPAFAEDTCNVVVTAAPKRVRAAIEARAGIESACTPLEVRVVKRGKKLLVTARSDGGDAYRGEAQDAGRVAELVMAWAAPTEPVVVETPPASPPPPEIEPQVTKPVDRVVVVAEERRDSGRDIGVGAVASPIAYGIRAEGDVLVWRGFALGLAFGASNAIWQTGDAMTGATVELRDIVGAAFVAKTFGTGAWRLRVQGGAGLIYTRYAARERIAPAEAIAGGDGTTRMLDLSLSLSREITAGWAVQLGPLLQYYAQTFHLDATRAPKREYEVGGYLAIKKRL